MKVIFLGDSCDITRSAEFVFVVKYDAYVIVEASSEFILFEILRSTDAPHDKRL
jgi:hypothetical protein